MSKKRTLLLGVACGLVLWTLCNQLNHTLSTWAFTITCGGLIVTFPALRLEHRDGWKIVFLLGLFFDADTPVRFGTHAVLFLTLFTVIHHFRQRVPRDEPLLGAIIAIVANIVILGVFTLLYLGRNPEPARMIARLISESALSSVAIALVAPWYFAFQEKTLERFGSRLRVEPRSSLI